MMDGLSVPAVEFISIRMRTTPYIGSRYGLDVEVKEPKDMASEPESRDIRVDKWQIILIQVEMISH